MSSQESTVSAGMYAPRVQYGTTVRAPFQKIDAGHVQDPKTDWVKFASDSVGSLMQNISDKKSKEEDTAKQQTYNNLALRANRIAEGARQGAYSNTEAETALRGLQMDALQQGIPEEDVAKIIGRHSWGLDKLEEDRQKTIMHNDEEAINKQVEEYKERNPGLQHLSNSAVRAMMEDTNRSIDDMGKFQQQMALLDPNSESYKRMEVYRNKAFEQNASMNIMNYLNNIYATQDEITPETLQALRLQGIRYGTSRGLSYAEAGLLVDSSLNRLGVTGESADFVNTRKITTENKKAGIEYLLQSAKSDIYDLPGAATMYALGGKAMEESLANMFISTTAPADVSMFLKDVYNNAKVKDSSGKVLQKAAEGLDANTVPTIMQAANNAMSNGSVSNSMKGSIVATGLEAFNNNNRISWGSSENQIQTSLLNTDSTRGFINIDIIRRTKDDLKNSADPEDRQLGEQIERDLSEFDGNEIVAKMSTRNYPHYTNLKHIKESMVADYLRYDEDGNVILTEIPDLLGVEQIGEGKYQVGDKDTAKRALAKIGKFFDAPVGRYKKDMDLINKDLANVDTETKKYVLRQLGIKAADFGQNNSVDLLEEYADKLQAHWNLSEGDKKAIQRARDKAGELRASATSRSSTPIAGASIVMNEDSDGLPTEMIEEHNQKVDSVRREETIARTLAEAIRKAKTPEEEDRLIALLGSINSKLEELGEEPWDPYND